MGTASGYPRCITDEAESMQFSANLTDRFCSGPRTRTAPVQVRDLVVCAADTVAEVKVEEYRLHLPVGEERLAEDDKVVEQVNLGRDAILCQLDNDEAELIVNACTQRGHYFHPMRQFGQRYAFTRSVPLAELENHHFAVDREGVLGDALMLSRLVRDNGFSMQYAARVVDYEDGQQSVIYLPGSEGKAVYRLRRDREWLDGPEAEELSALLAAFWDADLPPRVERAMWRVEYATWQRYADVALPMIVGGLEALLKIGRRNLTDQFKRRASALAAEVGVEGVDEDFCERMYDGRSDWVHGSHVELFNPAGDGGDTDAQDVLADIEKLQATLRGALRRTIEDAGFRSLFEADESITERWPA
jgi:hypothetical protein